MASLIWSLETLWSLSDNFWRIKEGNVIKLLNSAMNSFGRDIFLRKLHILPNMAFGSLSKVTVFTIFVNSSLSKVLKN